MQNNFLYYSVTGNQVLARQDAQQIAPILHEDATNNLLATIRYLQRDCLADRFRNTFSSQSQDRGYRKRRAGKPTKVVCVYITAVPFGTASLKRVSRASIGLRKQNGWLS